MPPHTALKKAAKKATKKAAKKAAKKAPHDGHAPKHHEGKDLRRAYEHLGRLHTLEASLDPAATEHIRTLTHLAQQALRSSDPDGDTHRSHKSAADLLRAAEHLAFGTLATTAKSKSLPEALEAAIHAELEHLCDKADEHWEDLTEDDSVGDTWPKALEPIYLFMRQAAETALHRSAYRRALEFARGAEALTHVHFNGTPQLSSGKQPRPLLE